MRLEADVVLPLLPAELGDLCAFTGIEWGDRRRGEADPITGRPT